MAGQMLRTWPLLPSHHHLVLLCLTILPRPTGAFHCPKYAGFNPPGALCFLCSQQLEQPSCLCVWAQIIIFHSAFHISRLLPPSPITMTSCFLAHREWAIPGSYLDYLYIVSLHSPIRTNSRRPALGLLCYIAQHPEHESSGQVNIDRKTDQAKY